MAKISRFTGLRLKWRGTARGKKWWLYYSYYNKVLKCMLSRGRRYWASKFVLEARRLLKLKKKPPVKEYVKLYKGGISSYELFVRGMYKVTPFIHMVKIRLGAFQQGLPLPFWFKAQVKKAIGITIRVIKKKTRTVKAEDFANVINWWYKDEQKLWRKQQIKRRYKSKKLKAKAKRSRDDVWKLRAHKAEWLKLRAQIKKQKKRYFNALCDYREFIINPVPEKKYFDVDHPYKNFQKDEKERTEGWYVEKVCELLDLDLEEYWGIGMD